MPNHPNNLLSSLSVAAFDEIRPSLTAVMLTQGETLAESHDPVSRVYFPHSGVISCVVETIGGGAIETGMIGRDGQFGGGLALDHRVSLNHVMVQVSGEASVAKSEVMRDFAQAIPEFRTLLIGYEQFFLAQVQQTAACNAAHHVQARMCKWLLRMHHLAGDELFLTQDFLAEMMGVRRTSVSGVAAELQNAGMIAYSRGRILIKDVEQIRRWACECDDAINSHYEFLFGKI